MSTQIYDYQGYTTPAHLAGYLRKGVVNPSFVEVDYCYFVRMPDGRYKGCALAAALIGMYRDADKAFAGYEDRLRRNGPWIEKPQIFASMLSIPPTWAFYIDIRHNASESRFAYHIADLIQYRDFFKPLRTRNQYARVEF